MRETGEGITLTHQAAGVAVIAGMITETRGTRAPIHEGVVIVVKVMENRANTIRVNRAKAEVRH